MDIIIREYENEDYGDVVDMLFAFYQEKNKVSSIFSGFTKRSEVEAFFRGAILPFRFSGVLLLAFDEDEKPIGFHFWIPCGLVGGEADYTTLHGGTYVCPTHRRKNVGSKLRNHAILLALDAGYESVIATVDDSNYAARALLSQGSWAQIASVYKSKLQQLTHDQSV